MVGNQAPHIVLPLEGSMTKDCASDLLVGSEHTLSQCSSSLVSSEDEATHISIWSNKQAPNVEELGWLKGYWK